MAHDDLTAAAAPPCHACEQPVARVEYSWHQDDDGRWRMRAATVCAAGHRVPVEPIEEAK